MKLLHKYSWKLLLNSQNAKFLVISISLLTLSSFNNCAGNSTTETRHRGNTGNEMPMSHPRVAAELSSQIILNLGDTEYLKGVYRQIFDSPNLSVNARTRIESVLYATLTTNQSNFGRPCNPLDPRRDPNLFSACAYADFNTVIPFHAPSTPAREAWRIQACAQLVEDDEVVNGIFEKTHSDGASEKTAITNVVSLFYPDDPAVSKLTEILEKLNTAMEADRESAMDRWRMMIYAVCETPYWQVL